MGNSSSGNHGGKRTTSDMLALDVRKLQRDGLLKPERSVSLTWSRNGKPEATIDFQVHTDRVTLDYRQRDRGGEWEAMKYPVRLAFTPCTYGGQRAWWLCPAVGCGRRVAVLYGGKVFACRHCHRLVYKSQRETPTDRAYRRANNLRDRLGWVPGVIHDHGAKPKGMHWKTFQRLQASHDASVAHTMASLSAKLVKMGIHID
ncbi:MAG: hypothetical protein JWR60_770 [Polaromonas sp.]|nr:hypothetical protein [Polaromonas sp.]